MRRFSLFRRGNNYYVQFKNPITGNYGTAISTKQTVRDEAVLTVGKWLEEGIPGKDESTEPVFHKISIDGIVDQIRQAELSINDAERILNQLKKKNLVKHVIVEDAPSGESFIEFLHKFWDYETSPYVKEKLSHGHRIGKRHCYEMQGAIQNYWKDYFQDIKLIEVEKLKLKEFSLHVADKGLAAKTINRILSVGTVSLKWAYLNDIIPSNPAAGLRKFSGKQVKRGIFTTEETKKLFALPWDDKRSKLGNLLAMTTGLRAGEILALRVVDIKDDRLHIRHSWNTHEGLKDTKTGEERFVPLLPSLRLKLLKLAAESPHGFSPGTFVFLSTTMCERPMDFHFLLDGLREMQLKMVLSEDDLSNPKKVKEAKEYWKKRNVVFHSWRHYYASLMANKLEARTVMLATGHKTQTVFESYANHANAEHFQKVYSAVSEEFRGIL